MRATPPFVERLLCLGVALLSTAFAQSPLPAPSAVPALVGPVEAVHRDRLYVKLAEGAGAELRDGALRSRTGVDLRAVAALFGRAEAEPMITALSWNELDRLHQNACRELPVGRRPGHLGLWFRLRAPSPAAAEVLLADLAREKLVEHVYLEPRYYGASEPVVVGDIAPPTPSFTAMQYSHDPSPLGHGIRRAQGILGARGRGVGFRMIETNWILDHEDISKLVAANFIGPVPVMNLVDSNHGVAGTSLLMADRNGYGITGIVDEVEPRFIAMELNGTLENSLMIAMNSSQPGDVLMLVLMLLIPQLGPGTWLPAEFFQSMFDATLTVTANGRVFVTCAGNGNRSLDDPLLLHRFDRSFRDSGSIMVAASAAGLLQRATYSNWGSRVDAHSWGDQVVAAGYGSMFYGGNDVRQVYTAGYSGTSASTPHVAGIVAAMQGAARRQLNRSLTTAEILAALHTYGASTPDVIGLRPDLPAILAALGIVDGLTADAPETSPGATVTGTLDAPALEVAGLFLSPNAVDIDFGFNRKVHVDPGALISVGAYVVSPAATPWAMLLPGDPVLQGVQLYFQAARVDAAGGIHLTNSAHVSIL